MKYKCLVFDHDDTVVNSTATIHHPCFQAYLDLRYPGRKCSLEEYFIKNFEPGFLRMCIEEYGMGDEELADETAFWREFVKSHIPDAYPGMAEIMHRHKDEGGIIAVVSHSFEDNIIRDYKANGLPEPDAVYGWGQPAEQRKPSPYPLFKIMKDFDLAPSDMLVIDDLKPGYDMAKAAGVDFAAVGWSNEVPSIEKFMRENCDRYFKTVAELNGYLR